MLFVRGSCALWSLTKMSMFNYFGIFGFPGETCFGPGEGVFTGLQQSTVNVRCPPGAW